MQDLADIRLLVTDLDGTLIGKANEIPLYKDFHDKIAFLRERNNLVWAICTGRSSRSFRAFFDPMRVMGIVPDYVVIRHAFIYGLTGFGFMPHMFWNFHIRYLTWLNRLYVSDAIHEWHAAIAAGSSGFRTIRRGRERLWLRLDSVESATAAAEFLREKAAPFRQLRVFQFEREVDLRAVPFTKGLAVAELERHLNVRTDQTLAIGNGSNDVSMLTPEIAGCMACPANSDPEVMEAVSRGGGHIARARSLEGVMEILNAYETGTVNSALPEGWKPFVPDRIPTPARSQRDAKKKRRRLIKFLLFLAVVYAILVVFAEFGMVPYGGMILKPYYMALRPLLKIVSVLSR